MTQPLDTAGQDTRERRRQRDAAKLNVATGKQPRNFTGADGFDVGVARVIHLKVVPDNEAAGLEYTFHFTRDQTFDFIIQDRCKHRELSDDVKRGVRLGQRGCTAAPYGHTGRTSMLRLGHPMFQKIDTAHVLRIRSPSHKVPKPVSRPATHVKDARMLERGVAASSQQVEDGSLLTLRDKPVTRVEPRIQISVVTLGVCFPDAFFFRSRGPHDA